MATHKPLTIGELEAGFSAYCMALRRLVGEERGLEKIERTLCWHNLQRLHDSLPQRYRSPTELYQRYERTRRAGGDKPD